MNDGIDADRSLLSYASLDHLAALVADAVQWTLYNSGIKNRLHYLS